MNFRLIKDCISKSFGLGTEKEYFDKNLKQYKIHEVNALKYLVAERNEAITLLQGQIYSLENYLNDNKEILDLCLSIFEVSENEILKSNSEVDITLYDENLNVFMLGNVFTLRKIVTLPSISNANFYIKQLEALIGPCVLDFIVNLIHNNGYYVEKNVFLDERTIYIKYLQIKQLVSLKKILCLEDNAVNLDGIELLLFLKKNCQLNVLHIESLLQQLYFVKDKLDEANSQCAYLLNLIDCAKQLIRTSKNYVQAQNNHEYLEQINKSR